MNLDTHFPPSRFRAVEATRAQISWPGAGCPANREPLTEEDFMRKPLQGLDYQGRYPEAAPAPAEASTHFFALPADPEEPGLRMAALIVCAFAWDFITAPLRGLPTWVIAVGCAVGVPLALVGAGALYGFLTR